MDDLREPLPRSPDEFLDWAERQDEKHEFVDGEIVMQAGASRGHERVAKRVLVALMRQVDDAKFDVNKGDFGVRIKSGRGPGSVLLPDVVVDLQSDNSQERATTTALVVIEVLSQSTDLAYHMEKLTNYAQLPSLIHYAVFSQVGPEVHLWRRTQEGWPSAPVVMRGLDATIAFPEIGAMLALSEICGPQGDRPRKAGS